MTKAYHSSSGLSDTVHRQSSFNAIHIKLTQCDLVLPHALRKGDEIAEAIVFLATGRASFIHGAKLAVDGGRTAI